MLQRDFEPHFLMSEESLARENRSPGGSVSAHRLGSGGSSAATGGAASGAASGANGMRSLAEGGEGGEGSHASGESGSDESGSGGEGGAFAGPLLRAARLKVRFIAVVCYCCVVCAVL
jgi:hypothetical protein